MQVIFVLMKYERLDLCQFNTLDLTIVIINTIKQQLTLHENQSHIYIFDC